MILTEDDLKYVSKRIKEETGVGMRLRKVHIDNTIPVTEENRKMFLDIVVDSYIRTKDSKPVSAKDIDGHLEQRTVEEFLGDE